MLKKLRLLLPFDNYCCNKQSDECRGGEAECRDYKHNTVSVHWCGDIRGEICVGGKHRNIRIHSDSGNDHK